MLPRQVGDASVADLLRLRVHRRRRQLPPGNVVAKTDADRCDEHVKRLRERDCRDERQGATPWIHQTARWAVEADSSATARPRSTWPPAQPTGDHTSKDWSVQAMRSASSRSPVSARKTTHRGRPSRRPRQTPVLLAVRPHVVETRGPGETSPRGQHRQTDHEGDPEHVEGQRVEPIEAAAQEFEAEERLRDVVLEGEG
jgi:hypothetical protein